MRVKSPHAASPRFPAPRSSAQGESAPKARPKGVADGKQVNIPVPRHDAMWGRRKLCKPGLGCPDLSEQECRVGKSAWLSRDATTTALPSGKLLILCSQEKQLSPVMAGPYRKPTLVGEMNILRRLRELGRRNSAN